MVVLEGGGVSCEGDIPVTGVATLLSVERLGQVWRGSYSFALGDFWCLGRLTPPPPDSQVFAPSARAVDRGCRNGPGDQHAGRRRVWRAHAGIRRADPPLAVELVC